jgi:hypothetical protein
MLGAEFQMARMGIEFIRGIWETVVQSRAGGAVRKERY